MINKKNIIERGQSLFEVVVAVSISALMVTGIVILASNSIQNSSYSRDKTIASTYAQQATEWLRKERDQNYEVFASKALYERGLGGDIYYCLNDLSWPNFSGWCSDGSFVEGSSTFTRVIKFPSCNPCDPDLVEAEVAVYWDDSKGNHNVISTTELSIR